MSSKGLGGQNLKDSTTISPVDSLRWTILYYLISPFFLGRSLDFLVASRGTGVKLERKVELLLSKTESLTIH